MIEEVTVGVGSKWWEVVPTGAKYIGARSKDDVTFVLFGYDDGVARVVWEVDLFTDEITHVSVSTKHKEGVPS